MLKTATRSQQLWGPAVPLGVGTMNWGNSLLDKFIAGKVLPDAVLDDIVTEALTAGVTFYDSAEGYGGGTSEERLGAAIRRVIAANPKLLPPPIEQKEEKGTTTVLVDKDIGGVMMVTKFLPTLWRWTETSFFRALEGSHRRMGVAHSEVYFIHTPVHPLPLEFWVRCAAKAAKQKKIKYLGLSNCNAEQVRRAVRAADAAGVPIVVNQILFNMITYNTPQLLETVKVCEENNIRIVAYSPLGQGLLARPQITSQEASKIRMLRMTNTRFDELEVLRRTLREVADKYPGHTMSHVCLAWVRAHNAIPLVGIRTKEQMQDAIASLTLKLEPTDVAALDKVCLNRHTFARTTWRRSFFVGLISTFVLAYRVVGLFGRAKTR